MIVISQLKEEPTLNIPQFGWASDPFPHPSSHTVPCQPKADWTAQRTHTSQTAPVRTHLSVSLTIIYEHDLLGMLRVMFTCGMSSSCVTLTKFSNIATMDGAAMTWQFTRSQRKRTCSAHYELNIKTYNKVDAFVLQMINSTNQANGLRVKVWFYCLLKLSDHGLHKLSSKVVVASIEKSH